MFSVMLAWTIAEKNWPVFVFLDHCLFRACDILLHDISQHTGIVDFTLPSVNSVLTYESIHIRRALTYFMWYKNSFVVYTWWRNQMETVSAILAICAGNSPVTGEFPAQRPETRSFDVFFNLHLNKRLSKQSWGWWFETPLRPLWRRCNGK